MTEVVWVATSATSGRFDAVERRSDIDALDARFAAHAGVSVERAWGVVHDFLTGRELGEWSEL